jgi:D-tagatose-1,6-bisphosphate aldolase subunit GatZ/KbaZ
MQMLKNLRSENKGICSICSANEHVLTAAIKKAVKDETVLLIESTSNQVDQFGGYTGMTPDNFVSYVRNLAESAGFPIDRLILGGDHLGPNAWQKEPAESAMEKACELIHQYVKAGYTKIHLDTSMRCEGDPGNPEEPLEVAIIAERAAQLCKVAENAGSESQQPVYVIGTDVPIPGGAQEHLSEIRITPVNEVEETIEISQKAFYKLGLKDAWERVLAVVVQPGVEFGDTTVIEYDRKKAASLSSTIEKYDNLSYEAHSTDYQTKNALRQMVEDHYRILKVGPWLTFAMRETLFALDKIENDLYSEHKNVKLSGLVDIIEQEMLGNPRYWSAHYHGDETQLKLARKYSYSDRIRYYWPNTIIQGSLHQLIENLSKQDIPLNILSQYLPLQYEAIREGKLQNHISDLIDFGIAQVLNIYSYATGDTV